MRLEGKVAIIAGAGQRPGEGVGNGRATAMLFAREGAKVILANRSIGSVEEARDLLRREGYEADCMACDVSREEDCRALIDTTARKHGRVDVLHNNVGIALADGDSAKIERESWQSTFDVNLTGAMLVTKCAIPVMRAQSSGCITHTSSIAAIALGTPWETAHAAVFLASDHAAYITGAILPIDGGLHTRVG